MACPYTKCHTQNSRLKLPYVLINYSKCDGDGACVTSCPGSVFELWQKWCKPADRFVKNTVALQGFQERIAQGNGPVSVAIRYHVPECFLCWQCIGACPRHAIDVEYDDLDIREYLLPAEKSTTLA
jgi:ferredoxin